MSFLSKFTILQRILIAFIAIVLLFIGFSIYTLNQVNELGALILEVHNHPLQVSNASMRANRNVIKMQRSLRDIYYAENNVELNAALNE